MSTKTKLTQAHSRSQSLRTTVPNLVTAHFNLEQGDELEWELVSEGGEIVVRVKPIKG